MDFAISPLKGANNIEFGMDAADVRHLIGESPEEFRRHDEVYPSDHFVETGVFGYYDAEGHLEALEFTKPARALIGIVNVLELPFGQAVSMMKQIDENAVVDRDSAVSQRLSMAFWSSAGFKEPNEPVETVLAGRAGYYDDPSETES